jgi:hypothetical protein
MNVETCPKCGRFSVHGGPPPPPQVVLRFGDPYNPDNPDPGDREPRQPLPTIDSAVESMPVPDDEWDDDEDDPNVIAALIVERATGQPTPTDAEDES